jgi:nucleoid-associated protein YgaU
MGRYLAPLALVAVIVATVLVVRSGLGTTHHATTTPPTRLPSTHRAVPRRRFYFVRAGDTLSNISAKTGVPVAQLQVLNPALASDPNALQTGQRLRLR